MACSLIPYLLFLIRNTMTEVRSTHSYIVSGSRTPIGAFLGGLSGLSAPELGAIVIEDCVGKTGLGSEVCEVSMGNVLQAGVGQAPARQAALKAGLAVETPCVTINKVCGSGLKTVMMADQAIRAGDASMIVAGGMESMSGAPHLAKSVRAGAKLGDVALLDALIFDGLTCAFEGCHMGSHAEYVAREYEVSRSQQDEFAARSQAFASEAIRQDLFKKELVTVTCKSRKGDQLVAIDECVREESDFESLSRLRPVFDQSGTVTAGNASTLADGAAAVVVVDHLKARQTSAEMVFKIIGSVTSGVAPKDLFIAPVLAIEQLAEKTGVPLESIDFFEINEAFAAQMVACLDQLPIQPEIVNVNGGGISLGHPIGASGARCLVTLMHILQENQARYGVVSLCLGGGNAVAMLIERIELT